MLKSFIGFSNLKKSSIKWVSVPFKFTIPRVISTSTMQRLVHSFTFLLLILLAEISSGQEENIHDGIRPLHLLGKIHSRKVLMDITMDYDYGGPNPKHDPGRKIKGNGGGSGGGGGGKNP